MTDLQHEQTPVAPQGAIPEEWITELQGYHPESHEYKTILDTLSELALGEGVVLDLRETGGDALETPKGFTSITLLEQPTNIAVDAIEQIHSLAEAGETLALPVYELVSDTGNKIRVCDMRSSMTESVKKVGPESEAERRKLDEGFWMDMKYAADHNGRVRNSVVSTKGVGYTKVPNSKIRGYFMTVPDANNPDHVPTFARLADCRDSIAAEAAIYRTVFAKKL